MRRIIFFVVIVSMILYGCSYSFVGHNSSLPGNIKTIYISNVVNMTSEPNLQIYLRDYLISTFDLDNRVDVVGSINNAQGALKVKIVNYDVEPVSYSSEGFASRYRCSISVFVSLISNKVGKVIEKMKVNDFEDFSANSSVAATERAKRVISKDVLRNLSLKIRDALFANF